MFWWDLLIVIYEVAYKCSRSSCIISANSWTKIIGFVFLFLKKRTKMEKLMCFIRQIFWYQYYLIYINKSCTAQNRSIWRKRISQTFRCFIFSFCFVLFCFFVIFLTLQWLITACKHAPLLQTSDIKKQINKGGKFLKKLWCCVGGRIKHRKLANVKSLKADVSSVSLSSERLVEGVTLETSAFKLFTMANLCYQLSW